MPIFQVCFIDFFEKMGLPNLFKHLKVTSKAEETVMPD
jgi:hypothetical protein